MEVCCDIETDSLSPTVIWCIGAKDLATGKVYVWRTEEEIRNGFTFFARDVTKWIGHNFLSFDAPALRRLVGVVIPEHTISDTLILSRLRFTGLRHKHSLESWGETLGYPKGEFTDFAGGVSPEMVAYMMRDVELTEKLYHYLTEELKGFHPYCTQLEHKVQAILNQQKIDGFYLNAPKAWGIHAELTEKINTLEKEIQDDFPPITKLKEVYNPRRTKDGSLYTSSERKLEKFSTRRLVANGSYELYETVPFNLGSSQQIVERMNELGWEPVEFTDKGTPKVSEANFATLPKDAPLSAHKIGEWLMLRNRKTVLENWFNAYNPETRRLHGTCIGIGAITHRMAHRNPQMGNIPAVRSPYGEALRSCLGVEDPDNYAILGVDLSSIQLCILAHYLDDEGYTNAVAFGDKKKGTDAHTFNRDILRQVTPNTDRDMAKTFIYAMLLGGGGEKLGSILGVNADKGYKAKKLLSDGIPKFGSVQRMCETAAKRGYMIGLDGRHTPVKSKHFALSVYLQCGEAIIMKQTLCFLHDGRFKHLDWKQLAVVHDEVQLEVRREQAEELARGILSCIVEAGKLFQLRCPLAGEYQIGQTWADSH